MLRRTLKFSSSLFRMVLMQPRPTAEAAKMIVPMARGLQFGSSARVGGKLPTETIKSETNPLRKYFDDHSEGHGIWKWLHYFDIYHRHFQSFIGRDVHMMEIGIYSG